jgi:hypothetical protein
MDNPDDLIARAEAHNAAVVAEITLLRVQIADARARIVALLATRVEVLVRRPRKRRTRAALAAARVPPVDAELVS